MIPLFGQKTIELSEVILGTSQANQAIILEDKESVLTIEEVLQTEQDQFKTIQHSSEIIEFTTSTYWLRLKVKNGTDQEEFILESAGPITNEVEYFLLDQQGNIQQQEGAGDNFPLSERAIQHRKNLLPFSLQPNESAEIIIRIKSDGEIIHLPLIINTVEDFWENESKIEFIHGIYYGLLLLVVIIYFFFFLFLKDRSFLYYILYVAGIFLLQFSLNGYSYQYLFPSSPYWADHIVLSSASLTVFFLILYAKTFLKTKERAPLLEKVLIGSMGMVMLWLLLSLTTGKLYTISYPVVNILSLIVILLVLGVVFRLRHRGMGICNYFTLAFTVLIAGAILFILTDIHVINNSFINQYALKISSGLEVIILSISMANKYREIQQEKEKAQQIALVNLEEKNQLMDRQNEILEAQVKERTHQIEEQKHHLAEKNKEIVDSINYAQRLQQALIPPIDVFKEILPESFVLFLPKDIVSGDFYWVADLQTTFEEKDNDRMVVFSAADCTGHGVPGAFMSIIGLKILNQSIKNKGVNTPAEALDFLNKEVYQTVNRHQRDDDIIRDGMDMSLCAINFNSLKLWFAGAKNPIYIIRNDELIELKADKQPIGSNAEVAPFTNHEFDLQKGDMIYSFTDGLPDQFGGPKGKKFKYKQFKEVLLKNAHLTPDIQKERLFESFKSWKGELEQLDDICVIGVKV